MRPLRHLIAATIAVCCCRPAAEAATIPVPTAIPDQAAFLVVYIPDLLDTIDHLEQAAVAINPKTPTGVMKSGLGGTLGDPQLAAFGKGPVVLILAPGMPMPSFAMILPTTNAQGYADALTKTGSMTKAVGGHLVVSKLPDGLELGERVVARLGDLGAQPVKGDIRVLVAFDKVMQSYGAFLSQMAMMAGAMGGKQPGQQDMAKLLPLYATAVQMVGGEVAMHQIDLGFSAEAITIDSTTAARPGGELAKALAAPVPCLHASEQRLGPDGGAMLMTMCLNRVAVGGYAKHLIGELMKRPEAKDLIPAESTALIDLAMKGYSGDFAARVRAGEGEAAFNTQAVYQVLDGAAAVDAHAQGMELTFSDKHALGKMYQAMGLTCTFTRDARTVGATKVHTVAMTMDAAKMPAGQAAQMKRFMAATELAVADGFMRLSQGGAVDALLKAPAQGPTFAARTVHGPGHTAYIDADPTGLALLITQAMPLPGMAEVTAELKKIPAGQPFTGAVDIDAGRARMQINLPTRPMAGISKVFEMQEAQKRKQRQKDEEIKPQDGATLF